MLKQNNRFTNGKPRIATENDCNAPWNGVKGGKHFRCGFCGYKFKPGDYWRWQYTNNIPGASGNPFVCEKCDEGYELTRKKWIEKWEEFKSDKWWWFNRK